MYLFKARTCGYANPYLTLVITFMLFYWWHSFLHMAKTTSWTRQHNWVFPEWHGNSVNSANSRNLINHWSMNWAQFVDPVSHMCIAGAMVAFWYLTQKMAGSISMSVITNILSLNWANSIKTFRKNSIGGSPKVRERTARDQSTERALQKWVSPLRSDYKVEIQLPSYQRKSTKN